jgi:hypothetical protein
VVVQLTVASVVGHCGDGAGKVIGLVDSSDIGGVNGSGIGSGDIGGVGDWQWRRQWHCTQRALWVCGLIGNTNGTITLMLLVVYASCLVWEVHYVLVNQKEEEKRRTLKNLENHGSWVEINPDEKERKHTMFQIKREPTNQTNNETKKQRRRNKHKHQEGNVENQQ